ncbi:MAG TPA: tetratricopeptide repeat protein [Pyrinomonadaceae bacterium]
MKRFNLILAALICLLLVAPLSSVSAKDNWTSVRSKNFYLVGNANEKDIRKVATRLEQFREVLARLLKVKFDSHIPINVIVFKSHDAYKPFAPKGTSGYFQPGEDVNYIALDAEFQGEYPFDTIFHEYVHFMINNNLLNVPVWFNEGLAEFYSTFDVAKDEQQVTIGAPISSHVYYLRQEKLIPLQTLFAVDHKSPLYNESEKRGVFYAESWALVHYLIHGDDGKHFPQLGAFLQKVRGGATIETAFQEAFQMDFKTLEKALKSYVGRNTYPARVIKFTNKVEIDSQLQSAPLTEAEGQFYMGDLLLHRRQLEQAEKYLQQAVALNPDLAIAHASLGVMRMHQKRFPEAKQHLQRAIAGDTKNYLVHFYYAYVLSREGMDERGMVRSYSPETVKLMREELKKSIALAPEYAESYHLLAFINLITNEQLDESIILLKRAMSLSPGEKRFDYVLAQIYIRKQDFKAARQLLEPIARNNARPGLQASAQSMLNQVIAFEEQLAKYNARREESGSAVGGGVESPALRTRETPGATGNTRTTVTMTGEGDRHTLLREAMRALQDGEQRVRGLLLRVDCSARGVTFIVKAGERMLKLHSKVLDGVQFTSWTPEVSGDMTCGARNPANDVVVIFHAPKDARTGNDGELVALDFVPKDFVLNQ